MALDFVDDEAAYLSWIAAHPTSFVLNTSRRPSLSLLVLHKADCFTVGLRRGLAHGTLTQQLYRKICAENIDDLRLWVRLQFRTDGSFSGHCSRCNPLDEPRTPRNSGGVSRCGFLDAENQRIIIP
jgi:hypothetical protein